MLVEQHWVTWLSEAGLGEYFPFIQKYSRIEEVLNDKDLASLGDAYVNFIYSLALSRRHGRPIGRKLDGSVLSSALRRSGARKLLPHRVDRHGQADAAEALLVYGWLSGIISIRGAIDALAREGDLVENVSMLLKTVLERSRGLLA